MEKNKFDSRKYSIPIYLNQRIVFDLLAVMEDGFSQLQTIKTSTSNEKSGKVDASAELGTKNTFSFLNIGVKASAEKAGKDVGTQEVSQEKVFTPASLFSKFRDNLLSKKLLISLDEEITSSQLDSGIFIEFSGVLSKNPLTTYIDGMIKLLQTASLFVKFDNTGTDKNFGKKEIDMLKKFKTTFTQEKYIDLITNVNIQNSETKVILPAQFEYFLNESPADIIDGQFVILGKISRVLPKDDEEKISLIRGTSLEFLPEDNFHEFTEAMSSVGNQFNFNQELTTSIKGPALLVIPIAVFA
jgi:hypothetical protein